MNIFLSWSGETTHLTKKLPSSGVFLFPQNLISHRSQEGVFS